MKIQFESQSIDRYQTLIVPFSGKLAKDLPTGIQAAAQEIIAKHKFDGEIGQAVSTWMNDQRIVVLGLGESKSMTQESLKTAGAKLTVYLAGERLTQATLLLGVDLSSEQLLSLLEGVMLRNYLDGRYKTGEALTKARDQIVQELTLVGKLDAKTKRSVEDLQKIVSSTFWARDLVASPPNKMKPGDLAQAAKEMAKDYSNLSYLALSKSEIEKLGMGLLSAVNRGSAHDPSLIVLTLNPDRQDKPIVLVGKGLTFDSGGYGIKPAAGMQNMHIDMAGGATVLGAMKALAAVGYKKKVIALVPATENLISGDAYKPSDIITAYNGTTVEIEHTDAEGRLILADALSYAVDKLNPKLMIDLATLTGACMVALGERYAGVFSREPKLIEQIQSASDLSGEKVWPLPLDETFRDKLKSKVADIGNIGSLDRMAGASTAAAFLSYFVGDTPWLHIDIAGPTQQSKELEAWNPPSGVSGFGVSLLTKLITDIIK